MDTGKNYTYINIAYLDELTDGDTEFMQQIVETYLASIPENVQNLTSAVYTDNANNIGFYAHKLKGSFYFMGSENVGKTFAAIEAYAREPENHHLITGLFWAAISEVAEATEELKQLLTRIKT